MPRGKDSYQALPGHEKLTWVDKIKSMRKSDLLETDTDTGRVVNPRREYMIELIRQREEAEKAEKLKGGGS
jgi:hypothetical protein